MSQKWLVLGYDFENNSKTWHIVPDSEKSLWEQDETTLWVKPWYDTITEEEAVR